MYKGGDVGLLACAVIDPVGDQGPKSDDTALDADEKASVGCFGAFGLVGWDCGGVDAIPHTGDCSTDNELGQGCSIPLSSDLNDDTQDHDSTAHHHGATSAEEIAKGQDEDGAEKTSDFVDCCHETLHGRVVFGGGEEVVEGWCGDDARHDTLVIAEEKEACGQFRESSCIVDLWCLPVVATVDTANDNGLPVRPMNTGGAIPATALYLSDPDLL